MINITIFGSYNGTSIGDTAILLGMLCSLERIYGKEVRVDVLVLKKIGLVDEVKNIDLEINLNEIVIGSSFYRKTAGVVGNITSLLKRIKFKLFPKTIIYNKKVAISLSDSDHLLIGGGNLVMDMYASWLIIIENICTASNKLNVKYSFVGVGAGPISTENGYSILKKCLMEAHKVYFRDKKSKVFCKDVLGFDDGFIASDFALGINSVSFNKKKHTERRILFNVADYYGSTWPENNVNKFNKYINGMASLALFIRKCYEFDELVIFNSNYTADQQASRNLLAQLQRSNYGAKVQIIEGRKSVRELIELGHTAQFAFTTRLHAGIIVAHGGCKLIGIAYQPKVKDVLEDACISPYIIDINSILNGVGFESIVVDSLKETHGNILTNERTKNDSILLDILENQS